MCYAIIPESYYSQHNIYIRVRVLRDMSGLARAGRSSPWLHPAPPSPALPCLALPCPADSGLALASFCLILCT